MLESLSNQSAKVYLISTLDPALRYEVLAYDEDKRTARLQGREGAFEMDSFTVEALRKQGYELKLADELPPLPPPTGNLCGKKVCNGKCPRSMWMECPKRGGKLIIH